MEPNWILVQKGSLIKINFTSISLLIVETIRRINLTTTER